MTEQGKQDALTQVLGRGMEQMADNEARRTLTEAEVVKLSHWNQRIGQWLEQDSE